MRIYSKSLAHFGVNNPLRDELDNNWLNIKNALLSDDALTRWLVNKALGQLLDTNNFNDEKLTILNDNIDTIRKCWGEMFYGKEV